MASTYKLKIYGFYLAAVMCVYVECLIPISLC